MAAGLPDAFPAPDRPPLSPPEPTAWHRARRRAHDIASSAARRARSPAARAGRWSTTFVAPAVTAVGVAALRPVAALLAVVFLAPVAVHTIAGERRASQHRAGRRGARRWLAPVDVFVRARQALRLSTTRAWVGLLGGAAVAAAIITLADWRWTAAGRFGLVTAAVAHAFVVGRASMFRPLVDRLPAAARAATHHRWVASLAWVAAMVAVVAAISLSPTWWPVPSQAWRIFHHLY